MLPFFINGKFITQQLTGVQRYAYELSRRVLSSADEGRLITPDKKHWDANYNPLPAMVMKGAKGNAYWEQIQLPLLLKKEDSPLLVNLCNMAPVIYKNKITCIHDIAFIRYPHFFSGAFYQYYKNVIPLVIQTSRHIITVSEFSKQELLDHFKISEKKVTVIPNGITRSLTTLNSDKTNNFPFDKPYFLFVGSLDPRKNLLFLIKAFKKAKLPDRRLIIIGSPSNSFNSHMQKRIQPYLSDPDIFFAGSVSEEELMRYYHFTEALVIPSLYEGFGLPLAEALAGGSQVIASDIPVFREIGGNEPLYFNLNNEDALINLLQQTNNKTEKKRFSPKLIDKFNWDNSSHQLLDLINNLRTR